MSDVTFRLAHLGEDAAIKAFINEHFDMRLPLVNRPEFYHYYYAGRGGVPQFAVAEQDGRYLSAAGYVLANTSANPDVWVSVWVAVKGHNGVGLELMNALPGLTHCPGAGLQQHPCCHLCHVPVPGLEGRADEPLLPAGRSASLQSGKSRPQKPFCPVMGGTGAKTGGLCRRPDPAGHAKNKTTRPARTCGI